jgi:pyrroloquinoline quinone (PQQ) biosynthesis protein C
MEKDLVAEAPYHPGYEDAVVEKHVNNWITEHLAYRNRHMGTAKKIVEFIKSNQRK